MSENFTDGQQACAVQREIASGGVPQVMKSELCNLCCGKGCNPWFTQIDRCLWIDLAREYQAGGPFSIVCFDGRSLAFTQQFKRVVRQQYRAGRAVLGIRKVDRALLQVHVSPSDGR